MDFFYIFVNTNLTVFSNVTLYGLADGHTFFGGICCNHLHVLLQNSTILLSRKFITSGVTKEFKY